MIDLTTHPIVPAIDLPEVSPPSSSSGHHRRTTLPLSQLSPAPAPAESQIVFGLAKIDCHGRVGDAGVERATGWAPGTRLSIREHDGLILIRPDERGVFSITRQGHLQLPVTVRRWCGLTTGDRVLMAVDVARELVVVYQPAKLEALLAPSHAALIGDAA
jgi:hypothetical protein